MSVILQLTETAVDLTSLAAGVLLAVLMVIMAVMALGPYLPWDVGRELDTAASEGYAVDDPDAVEES